VNLWTARINYSGADRVDISRAGCDRARKAGGETPGEFLAPSAALVFPVLRAMKAATTDAEREQVWTDYATLYRLEMLASHKARRPEWEAFLQRERATIVCYCVPVNGVLRCHRVLAAGYLARLGATYCGEVNA
jgi:uncharacterized protein YeaO (DUF488 family)